MKKILFSFVISLLLTSQVGAQLEDNSLIEELDATNTQSLDLDFSMKSFESCDAFEDVMEDYIKSYWKNTYKKRYRGDIAEPLMMMKSTQEFAFEDGGESGVDAAELGGGQDISATNTQVIGVDESDIVKTDGRYHYYFNEDQQAVFIIDAKDLKLVKKLNLPESFSAPELYIDNNRLVIISGGYTQMDYSSRGYYFDRNSRTYTIVYDTSDISNLKLLKLYTNDGYLGKTRKIGDYLYVLSNNYISFPYWDISDEDDVVLSAEKMIPQKLDISRSSNPSKQNLKIKGKKLPFNIQGGKIADCNAISYSFPNEETLKKMEFNPGYNIISAINIRDTKQEVKTHVVAGNNSEIYMSQDNLYLTEAMWQSDNFSCPRNAICAMPFFRGGTQNTLVHKLSVDNKKLDYKASTLLPGAPLNQYSMDEHNDNFRIITSHWKYTRDGSESSTGLYVLDKDLKKVSELTNLAPGESFQSSRFIGNKLFLVTFEQVDPLFAIDLSDETQPKILGELKIPGYSTYLHPYDETHLIGLGYDTELNKWGGVQNAGIKVDLYKIHYDKKCGDDTLTAEQKRKCKTGDYKGIIVEQKYTDTFGGKGSYSDALSNPRMFVWNKDRKMLLLPASLSERDEDYKTTDYYNGLLSIQIDANAGVKLKNKVSHVDIDSLKAERDAECSKHTGDTGVHECKELLDGTLHCESPKRKYVPNYCYKDSTLWQYFGDTQWEHRNMQVKRALYVGDNVYAISDSKIASYDWDLSEKNSSSFSVK